MCLLSHADSFFGFGRLDFWDVIKAYLTSKRAPDILDAFAPGKELVESISTLSSSMARMRAWIRHALRERYLGDFILTVAQDITFSK